MTAEQEPKPEGPLSASAGVKVTCPRCSLRRVVHPRSTTARVAASALRLANDNDWLLCVTCRLLRSRDMHQAAIDRLNDRIRYRRNRGL